VADGDHIEQAVGDIGGRCGDRACCQVGGVSDHHAKAGEPVTGASAEPGVSHASAEPGVSHASAEPGVSHASVSRGGVDHECGRFPGEQGTQACQLVPDRAHGEAAVVGDLPALGGNTQVDAAGHDLLRAISGADGHQVHRLRLAFQQDSGGAGWPGRDSQHAGEVVAAPGGDDPEHPVCASHGGGQPANQPIAAHRHHGFSLA